MFSHGFVAIDRRRARHVPGSQRAGETYGEFVQRAGRFACRSWRIRAGDRISLWHLATPAGRDSSVAGQLRLYRRWSVSTSFGQAHTWEVARMNSLAVYLLMAPLLAVGVGLAIFWLTGWMDRREQQRHPAE